MLPNIQKLKFSNRLEKLHQFLQDFQLLLVKKDLQILKETQEDLLLSFILNKGTGI